MSLENRNSDSMPATDQIISLRLNLSKDRDIIRHLNQTDNKSAEIKRILRAYLNFTHDMEGLIKDGTDESTEG